MTSGIDVGQDLRMMDEDRPNEIDDMSRAAIVHAMTHGHLLTGYYVELPTVMPLRNELFAKFYRLVVTCCRTVETVGIPHSDAA